MRAKSIWGYSTGTGAPIKKCRGVVGSFGPFNRSFTRWTVYTVAPLHVSRGTLAWFTRGRVFHVEHSHHVVAR